MHQSNGQVVANGFAAGAKSCSARLVLASFVVSLVLLLMPFMVVEIVLGAQFWSSCPIERMVPIYLIFGGCLGLLLCVLCSVNFLLVYGFCQYPNCIQCKEGRVGITVCLAIVNCMWLACGFAFTYKADALHSSSDATVLASTAPTDTYLYCSNNLLGFTKAALFIRLGFLACIVALKRLMYFDVSNLTHSRPIALGSKK